MIGAKLGEGSFGIVYSGAFLPKNVKIEEPMSRGLEIDGKDKVILKKVISFSMQWFWMDVSNLFNSMF